MNKYTVIEGDCLEVLRGMENSSIDSIVTDPPAGISFMGKQWDKDKGGKAQWVEWMTEVATECLRVIKPGGHALVWSIPRTSHWTGDAWENAGWQPRDKIYHCFGSGFPKSHNVSKAIDKAAGVELKVVGKVANPDSSIYSQSENKMSKDVDITTSTTLEAQQWEGWGTALKPAIEEWWLFRKPVQGTIAQNVQTWGCGGINVDGCRVEYEGEKIDFDRVQDGNIYGSSGIYGKASQKDVTPLYKPAGRWPANLVISGEPEVVQCFPETKSGKLEPWHKASGIPSMVLSGALNSQHGPSYGDSGSAARFFQTCPDNDPEDAETRRLIYQGKATKRDRDEGLEGFYDVIIDITPLSQEEKIWAAEENLVWLRVDMGASHPRVIVASGVLSKSATEWNTLSSGKALMVASHLATMFTTEMKINLTTELRILSWFLGLLINESMEDANLKTEFGGSRVESVGHGSLQMSITSEKAALALGAKNAAFKTPLKISVNARRNNHVCVKPTPLMAYLCRLITPPGGVILDPFCGSGSTGKAAILEGFRFIGIEMDPEYVAIANARIDAVVKKD